MSHLSILTFKYNLAKLHFKSRRAAGRLASGKDKQFSDLMKTYKPDDEEMKKVFDKIASKAGKITREDLQGLVKSFGTTADPINEARRMFCVADYKKDGYIDLEEFMEVHKNGVPLSDIRAAFFVFDKDDDGRISAEEVWEVLHKLGDSCSRDECQRMVKEIDRNHDGFVDMDDFMAMMTRTRKKHGALKNI